MFKKIILLLLLLAIFFSPLALGSVTPTSPVPADNATNVWVNQPTLSALLNESSGQTMNGTITLVATGDTYTISTASNGTQTLTIPSGSLPLDSLTTYQWYVNASNETSVWTNTSYNFTTGAPQRMSESADFSAEQLLLIGFIIIAVCLVVLVTAINIMEEKKLNVETLIGMVIVITLMVVVLGFI